MNCPFCSVLRELPIYRLGYVAHMKRHVRIGDATMHVARTKSGGWATIYEPVNESTVEHGRARATRRMVTMDQPTRLLDTQIRTSGKNHSVLLPEDKQTRQKVADQLRANIVAGSPCGFYDPESGGAVNFITEVTEASSR